MQTEMENKLTKHLEEIPKSKLYFKRGKENDKEKNIQEKKKETLKNYLCTARNFCR